MADLMRKISDHINEVFKILSAVFLLLVVFASFTQVFTRYVLNNSLVWTEEFARYAFIWLTMCGASVASKKGTHATVDFLVQKFTGGLKTAHSITVYLMILTICSVLVYQSVKLLGVVSSQLSPAMRLSMTYVYLAVPVGAVVIMIHSLAGLLSLFSPGKAAGQEAGVVREQGTS